MERQSLPNTFDVGRFSTDQTFHGGIREETSLRTWALDYNTPAWYRFVEGELCLDLFTSLAGPRRPLLVMAQDALVANRLRLPWFYRAKWRKHFPEWNVVTFNDPTLYADRQMRAGYLVKPGARDLLNRALNALIERLEIETTQTVHYGASAGGYHVLSNAPWFPEAIHVADIPRVHFLSDYATDNMEIIKRAVGVKTVPSVMDIWRQQPSAPTIRRLIYLQNSADSRFVRSQLPSFLALLAESSTQNHLIVRDFELRFYEVPDHPRGHTPLPEARIIPLLRKLLEEVAASSISRPKVRRAPKPLARLLRR